MNGKKFKYMFILIFVLLLLFNIKSFASEILEIDDGTLQGGETASTFSVKIPRKISLAQTDNGFVEGEYKIEVKNYSEIDGSYLIVEPDSKFEITTYLKEDIEVSVNQVETVFSNSLQTDLTEGHTTIGYITSNEPLSSGNWQGSFSFIISMKKVEEQDYETEVIINAASPSNAERIEEGEEQQENIIWEKPIYIATPSEVLMIDEFVKQDIKE